jgi:uncharacterized protein (TIGR03000 family)
LLVATDVAQAQRRGSGGRVNLGGVSIGWGSGAGYGGRGYYGGNNWYGNNYYGGRGAYGNNWYGSGYGTGFYGSRYYSPGYSTYYPSYNYSYPSNSYYYSPSTDYVPSTDYYPPATQQYSQPQSTAGQIRVLVADAAARVWFDGHLTQQTGTDRTFTTPAMQANSVATYRVRASWMQAGREVVQERVVSVNAGGTAVVDFTQSAAEPLPDSREPRPQATPRDPQPAPQTQLIEGRILSTGQDQFVVETRDNRQVTIFTNPQTRYTLNNNPALFNDIRVGNIVRVDYRMDGTRHIGSSIAIRP